MTQTIVLVTSGKNESVHTATVHIFAGLVDAIKFRNTFNSEKTKHWFHAEIVESGQEVELVMPDFV